MKTIHGRTEIARLVGGALALAVVICPGRVLAQGCINSSAHALNFTTVERNLQGPYSESEILFIRDLHEWNATFNDLAVRGALTQTPVEPPHVDWKKQGVVLVALGECPTYGFDVEIQGMWKVGRRAVIEVEYVSPGGGLQIQSLTSPYHMICFDKTGISEVEICQDGIQTQKMDRDGVHPRTGGDSTTIEAPMSAVSWSELKTRFD